MKGCGPITSSNAASSMFGCGVPESSILVVPGGRHVAPTAHSCNGAQPHNLTSTGNMVTTLYSCLHSPSSRRMPQVCLHSDRGKRQSLKCLFKAIAGHVKCILYGRFHLHIPPPPQASISTVSYRASCFVLRASCFMHHASCLKSWIRTCAVNHRRCHIIHLSYLLCVPAL